MDFFLPRKGIHDMDKTSELVGILNKFFKWNKARLTCFTHMLIALFIVRTVNLSEIALAMDTKAQVSSRYKQLQRFFKYFIFDYDEIARWVFWLFGMKGKKVYLAMDRTNWCWGKSGINVFTLSVICGNVAIPIFWHLLPKKGNSSFEEQRALITRFIRVFKKKNILGLLADREFGHGDLLRWLRKENIPFYIRIKNGALVKENRKDKNAWAIKHAFSSLNNKEQSYLATTMTIYNNTLYVGAGRSEKGELMIVVTNQDPKDAINIYLKRWGIETLFSCLKGRGFNFEDTHMTRHERIAKLMALLTIGFCWAFKLGQCAVTRKVMRLKMKTFKDGKRPQKSIFRLGLDFIRETFINPSKLINNLNDILGVLNRPLKNLEAVL